MSTEQAAQADVFEDQSAAQPEAKTEGGDKGEVKTGEEATSAPPTEKQEDTEGAEAGANDKMIPEHRLKAAIKDVTEKFTTELNETKQKLAAYEAIPIPDKDKDPEGYNLHVRMEASKAVMRETKEDYDVVIGHYKEMADANPFLNEQVAAHPIPAKFAYDLAKKDLKIQELSTLESSDDWKEFQELKKTKAAKAAEQVEESVSSKLANGASRVPNLNRATNVANNKLIADNKDDELFKGAL